MLNIIRKPAGNAFNPSYIWEGYYRNHQYTIYNDESNDLYYYTVSRKGQILYESLPNNLTFKSVNEAGESAEEWIEWYKSSPLQKQKRQGEKYKFSLLVRRLREVCSENTMEETVLKSKIVDLLAEVGESID